MITFSESSVSYGTDLQVFAIGAIVSATVRIEFLLHLLYEEVLALAPKNSYSIFLDHSNSERIKLIKVMGESIYSKADFDGLKRFLSLANVAIDNRNFIAHSGTVESCGETSIKILKSKTGKEEWVDYNLSTEKLVESARFADDVHLAGRNMLYLLKRERIKSKGLRPHETEADKPLAVNLVTPFTRKFPTVVSITQF